MDSLNQEKARLKITDIIAGAFKLYKNNFVILASICAVMFIGQILYLWFEQQCDQLQLRGVFWICNYFVGIWAIMALMKALSAFYKGEPIHFKEAYGSVRGHFWMCFFVSTFSVLASLNGFLLLIVPGIYIVVILFLADVSAILDKQSFFDHLRISKLLVRGAQCFS